MEAERLTRLDRMLITEQQEQGVIDLRPDAAESYPVRANRHLLIDRVKRLERYGVATEIEPGRWALSDRAEPTAEGSGRAQRHHQDDAPGARRSRPRRRARHRPIRHPRRTDRPAVVGRVLAKGLAGDEMGDRLHLIIDGVDGRVHHVEIGGPDPARRDRAGHIVAPIPSRPSRSEAGRPQHRQPWPKTMAASTGRADIWSVRATASSGRARRPRSLHPFPRPPPGGPSPRRSCRAHRRRSLEDPEGHRRAWQGLRPARAADGLRIRTLSTIDLDRQIGSDGATWLDRQIVADGPLGRDSGFGREVNEAISVGPATCGDRPCDRYRWQTHHVPPKTMAPLERQEVDRVGQQMARDRGLTYVPANASEYVSGRLAGVASLVSGRFAMIDNGLGFQLVPWQPLLEKRIGQHISGLQRDDGGIEWSFGRKRELGIGL